MVTMFKPSSGGHVASEPHSCGLCQDVLLNAQSQFANRNPRTGVVSLRLSTERILNGIRSGCDFLGQLFGEIPIKEHEQEIHVKFDPPSDFGNITSIYSPSHTGCDFDILAPASE